MSENKKFINIQEDVLIEWIYSNGSISENYSVWSNLKTQTRNFVSVSSNNNIIDYTLFNVDPVLKKYAKYDSSKFNFLKIQDYFSAPIQYDKININFPFNYNFDDYVGFLFKVYCYDYETKKLCWFSNYYYDKSDPNIEKIMQIGSPFKYGEKEWGKYIELSIPSIDIVSNQRLVNSDNNRPIDNSINSNITLGGLNLNTPIFIDFSFIISKENVLGTNYFYIGDTFKTSLSKTAEYQSLGVTIQESDTWDFFEIYGFYNDSNENLDNFVRELEERGRKINIEYIITLYEENVQSGFPVKFLVTENFAQKVEYRPIFKYSNTTAAIDVEMHIKDLVDNSSIIRRSSIGLTSNLFKYGKKLSRLQIDTITKPKIYNYRSDKYVENPNLKYSNTYGITKVPYPLLISNYKVLINSTRSSSGSSEYKAIGKLTILLTPFDNVIKFKISRQITKDSVPEPYDLTDVLSNAKLTLIFKSDTEMIEKQIFYESDQNNIKLGTVVYKIQESDVRLIKKIYDNDFDNFYLTVVGNDTRTLLYSGKFRIFEDVDFLDDSEEIITEVEEDPKLDSSVKTQKEVKKYLVDDKKNSRSPFKEENLPLRPIKDQSDIDYYRNVIIYMKDGLSTNEKNNIRNQILKLGLSIYYNYDNTYVIERVHISKIKNLTDISNVSNVIQLKLNLGWGPVIPPTAPKPPGENITPPKLVVPEVTGPAAS